MNRTKVRDHVIESLSDVRGDPRSQIDEAIELGGGDLRIDSKEGEAICAIVEDALELGTLIEPADLEPEQLTTIESLTRLILERVAAHHAADEQDAA